VKTKTVLQLHANQSFTSLQHKGLQLLQAAELTLRSSESRLLKAIIVSTPATRIASEPPNDSRFDAQDARWELVHRIISSSTFARSAQLPKLLVYICRMAIADRVDEINEQRIGIEVFGRSPDYDPGVDGIVRSHATRLRQRLEIYFTGEGRHEMLRMEIPRGGYVPRFYPIANEAPLVSDTQAPEASNLNASVAEIKTSPVPAPQQSLNGWLRNKWIKPFLAGLSISLLVLLVTHHLRHDAAIVAGHPEIKQSEIEQRFWSSLFSPNGKTIIVPGDSGLVLYETLTGQEVTLADYVSGVYRDPNRNPTVSSRATQPLAQDLASRRYTSIVDLNMASQLSHLPQWSFERAATIFARDLRPSVAANSNLILLGSKEANPWVSLVEPSMNFVLTPDKKWGFCFHNRHPQKGESEQYTPQEISGGIGAPSVYGDVAYLPNPSGKGMILVLSGLWMSGTESAADFVLDGNQFSNWLKSIASSDGTIPPFELLIATRSLESSATNSSIIAKRVYARL
jgi:hypothetical protein